MDFYSENNLLNFVKNKFNIIEKIDKLYIGGHDLLRDDEYKGVFKETIIEMTIFVNFFIPVTIYHMKHEYLILNLREI